MGRASVVMTIGATVSIATTGLCPQPSEHGAAEGQLMFVGEMGDFVVGEVVGDETHVFRDVRAGVIGLLEMV